MKCIVLAGGKEKMLQFTLLADGMSSFQETIVRNIPYSDEFWIVTTMEYKEIVEEQMQVFHQVPYRCFYEEEGYMTRTIVMFASILLPDEEKILVVNSDTKIPEDNQLFSYKEALIQSARKAEQGKIVCVGVEPKEEHTFCGFVKENENGLSYVYLENPSEHGGVLQGRGWYCDTGILFASVHTLKEEFQRISQKEYEGMKRAVNQLHISGKKEIEIPKMVYQNIEKMSIGEGLFSISGLSVLVRGKFQWKHFSETDVKESLKKEQAQPQHQIIRLKPAYKDYLWGGTALKTNYNKKSELENIAEAWELSAHEAGQSIVDSGVYKGMQFGEYLQKIGRKAWGWKCRNYEKFPLLVKLIDARDALSIQVHPDDEYALLHENEYGKNEMWYVLEAAPGACLYAGFRRDVTREEVLYHIQNDTLEDILNKIPVEKGQTIFIKTGMVHAIGAGIVICEIQQSSNVTYRLYDYGRRDKEGNLRPLHIRDALQVIDCKRTENIVNRTTGASKESLCTCKYFSVEKYKIEGHDTIICQKSSFLCIIIMDGTGTIALNQSEKQEFQIAETFFIPAQNSVISIEGVCELLCIEL